MHVNRSQRSAFTLVELLVVIAIVTILAALTAVYFPRFQDQERGADKLQGWLLSAKMQAKRDGRPTGLRLTLDSSGTIVTDLAYIQQPDNYARGIYIGFAPAMPPQGQTAIFSLPMGVSFNTPIALSGSSEAFVVQVGDYLELFGGGVLHRIAAVGTNTLTVEPSQVPLPPMDPMNLSTAINYRIIPQPRTNPGEQPLTMPGNIAISFEQPDPMTPAITPLSRNVPARTGFLEILFAPSGAVIGQGTGTGQIIFWVRDITDPFPPPPAPLDLLLGKGTLITVQPRTGFIAAHPVASGSDPYAFTRDGRTSGM